jgi:hypothetical protein
MEFARVLHGGNAGTAFSILSGNGADQTGRSRMPFARYQGEARIADRSGPWLAVDSRWRSVSDSQCVV